MKKKKILIPLVLILLVLSVLLVLLMNFKPPVMFNINYPELPEELAVDILLTSEQVKEDREKMIESVENIHPFFVLEEDLSGYQVAKEKYISETEHEMTVGDFRIATAEYLCFFGDGHTGAKWYEDKFLDISWKYQEGGLFIIPDDEAGDARNDLRIATIGGVDTKDIFAQIDKIRPAENDIAHLQNYENYAGGQNILKSVGAEINDDKVVVIFADGSSQEYRLIDPYANMTELSNDGENITLNSWYMQDDVFVVDFNVCEVNEELESIATQMEKAVNDGITKFIIDARGNGGGNSDACVKLLDALEMKVPQYGMFVRYSKEAAKQNGYLWKNGEVCYEGKNTAKANNDVLLVILCDRVTFSAATMLLVFVRDGELGTIIGEPSSNMPSAYGDIIYFTLDNSHVWGTISHKQFIRPDADNKERMLIPDVQTEPEDALKAALEYLQKN